ncbi:hypothetical protein NFI96_026847 [Prochilodus magdalenae]|nr:hypothetical protein NFI96_026847 [Prochilodus magdalenae]
MFKLHGMDYHRTPSGTSTAPYRDVWPRCCLQYRRIPVRCAHLKGYSIQITTRHCDLSAIIFQTVNDRYICADPLMQWTQDRVTCLKPVSVCLLEHPHTVPADGAVGVEVEGHQVFWTCDDKPFISVLTTVPPHTDSLGVSTKTKAGLVTEDDPLPF